MSEVRLVDANALKDSIIQFASIMALFYVFLMSRLKENKECVAD